MPLLSAEKKIYAGGSPAVKVYAGSTLVWISPTAPRSRILAAVPMAARFQSTAANVTTGNLFQMSRQVAVVAITFYRDSTSNVTSRTMRLYGGATSDAQTLLGTTAPTVESAGFQGWVEAPLLTPVKVPVNHWLCTSCTEPVGQWARYEIGSNPAQDTQYGRYIQGRYGTVVDGYPASVWGNIYSTDIVLVG